ncbi:endocuticle structural glycoprotein SgAbd-2 [Camponotus floridanus]|uniref:endocuticle structural glycoprotein SgAbd-2 n=1 Tax=Camponotus floridanus TaxID=104421 RepID=UPI000DC66F04|nr:endocuticle structural glycoprotein SgAbd-2 [Camponotus floridanus]
MNLLIITVCVLIEATVIMTAKPARLSVTNSPATLNQGKFYAYTYKYNPSPSTTPFSTRSTSTPTPYYSRSKKSLYNYNYNTDTSIQAQEQNYLNNLSTDQETLKERGSYNYIDNDGNTFQVSHIAHEDGFQPKDAHLPTLPSLIKKALQNIAEYSKRNGKE